MLSEQDEGAEGFHASTLTSDRWDGKHSEKLRGMLKKALVRDFMADIERRLRYFCALFLMAQLKERLLAV